MRVVALAFGALAASASAATLTWTNASGGLWQDAGNWSPNSTARSTNNVLITNAGPVTVVVDDTTADSDPGGATSWMLLGSGNASQIGGGNALLVNFTNASKALVFSNAGNQTSLIVGNAAGEATLLLSNGTVEVRTGILRVGTASGASGTLAVRGGTLLITNASNALIGYESGSTGILEVAEGTVIGQNARFGGGSVTTTNATGFWIARGSSTNIAVTPVFGYGSNSYGRLEVRDSALFLNQDSLNLGAAAGATGVVVVSGGSYLATNLQNDRIGIGMAAGGYGHFILSNGVVDLRTTVVDVGYVSGSRGELTVAGGLMTITNGSLVLGASSGSVGTATIWGGALATKTMYLGAKAGPGGSGSLVIHGGAVTNSSALTVGDRTNFGSIFIDGGSLAMTAGTFRVGGENAMGYGSVMVTGGTLKVDGSAVALGGYAGSTAAVLVVGNGIMDARGVGTFAIGHVAGATASVTVADGSILFGGVELGLGAYGVGALNVYGGSATLTNSSVRIAQRAGSYGLLNLTGGTTVINSATYAGFSADATGRVVVSGGNLAMTNAAGSLLFTVAYSTGLGTFAQTNGDTVVNNTVVNPYGQMSLAGGSYSNTGYFYFYGGIGVGGVTSSVVMSGGALSIPNPGVNGVMLGSGAGPAIFSVSGGMVTLSNVAVGRAVGADASWLISGGTNTVLGSAFSIGNAAGYTGQVVLSQNGRLIANGAMLNMGSSAGAGSLILGDNSVFQAAGVSLNGSNALIRLEGGSATLGSTRLDMLSGGRLLQNGGDLILSNAFNNSGGDAVISNGTIRVLGFDAANKFGASIGGGLSGGRGSLGIYGGLFSVSGSNFLVGVNYTSTGSVSVANGGILELSVPMVVGGATSGKTGFFTNRNGGVLRFLDNAPTVTVGAFGTVVTTNAVVEFMGASAFVTNALGALGLQANNTLSLNAATNAALPSLTFGGDHAFSNLRLLGNSRWQSADLNIETGGSLLVSNADARVDSAVNSSGEVRVVNARVTYGGPVTIRGSYVSDPSTNTFESNLTVAASGSLAGSNGDLFVFYRDWANASTNRSQFDLAFASVLFTNGGGATNHTLDLTGSGALDLGSNWLNVAQLATNFAIGTFSLAAGNTLTLTGDVVNALYVGALDLQGLASTNELGSRLWLGINLYYEAHHPGNAYLNGLTYDLPGSGFLIPIPEPSALGALATGSALLWFLRRRRV